MNELTVDIVQAKWFEKLPPLRLRTCWSLFSVALLMFYAIVGMVSFALHGPDGLVASTIAAAVCWLGASVALAGTAYFGRTGINGPLYTLAFGLLFNGALPFSVGLALNRAGGAVADAGVFGLSIVFLQFALVVETLFSLCLLKHR
jgi:hypothetical protein